MVRIRVRIRPGGLSSHLQVVAPKNPPADPQLESALYKEIKRGVSENYLATENSPLSSSSFGEVDLRKVL